VQYPGPTGWNRMEQDRQLRQRDEELRSEHQQPEPPDGGRLSRRTRLLVALIVLILFILAIIVVIFVFH
jgi:hypothetical protein